MSGLVGRLLAMVVVSTVVVLVRPGSKQMPKIVKTFRNRKDKCRIRKRRIKRRKNWTIRSALQKV